MNVVLDGETLESSGTAQSLDLMRETLRQRRLVPTRLKVDGREVGLERLAGLAGAEASIELDTVTLESAADRAYADAGAQMPLLKRSIEACCDDLIQGRTKEAMARFSDICRGLDAFFGLMLPLEALVNGQLPGPWIHAVEDIKPLFLAMQEAVEQQDWVLVGDQLLYEWAPRVQLWCDRLPQARTEAARLAETAVRVP